MAKKVLIVDDNEDSAASMALLLQMKGHEVLVAHNGVDAVARALEFAPDTVLLDLGMPGLDGFQTAQELRKHAGPERLFLVAVTGWSEDVAAQKSLQSGFNHYLIKPVDTDALDRLLAGPPSAAGAALTSDPSVA